MSGRWLGGGGGEGETIHLHRRSKKKKSRGSRAVGFFPWAANYTALNPIEPVWSKVARTGVRRSVFLAVPAVGIPTPPHCTGGLRGVMPTRTWGTCSRLAVPGHGITLAQPFQWRCSFPQRNLRVLVFRYGLPKILINGTRMGILPFISFLGFPFPDSFSFQFIPDFVRR